MMKLGRGAKSDFFWPLAALGLIAFVLSVAGSLALVNHFDTLAKYREQNVVENGISNRIAEVAKQVLPQVMWDDAVQNLDLEYNAEWAKENIGIYLHQTNGMYASFVLDENNRPFFSAINGKPTARFRGQSLT
jgi:sensor domain CHASE-containing protein